MRLMLFIKPINIEYINYKNNKKILSIYIYTYTPFLYSLH